MRTAPSGLTSERHDEDARGGAGGEDGGGPRAARSNSTTATNQTTSARARARVRLRPTAPGGQKRGDAEEDGRGDERDAPTSRKNPPRPSRPGARVDDRPRGAEADRLGRGERLEEAEELAEQDRPARDGLREDELGGAAVGGEGQDADEERGERHEQQHELHEGDGGAREVLDPVPAGQHVAGPRHPEGEDAEDDGEDLRPARPEGEDELFPREEEEEPHRVTSAGGPAGPNSSAVASGAAAPGVRVLVPRRRVGMGDHVGAHRRLDARRRWCRRPDRRGPRPSSGGRPRRRRRAGRRLAGLQEVAEAAEVVEEAGQLARRHELRGEGRVRDRHPARRARLVARVERRRPGAAPVRPAPRTPESRPRSSAASAREPPPGEQAHRAASA